MGYKKLTSITLCHKERSDATASDQVGPKLRVWGASPTSSFTGFRREANPVKRATVATVALLAGFAYEELFDFTNIMI